MSDIDDILTRYGIPSNNNTERPSESNLQTVEEQHEETTNEDMQEGQENQEVESQSQSESETLTDADIDNVLSEHGFTEDEGNGLVGAYGEGVDYVDDSRMHEIDNPEDNAAIDDLLNSMDREEHEGMEDTDMEEDDGYDENQGEGHDDEDLSDALDELEHQGLIITDASNHSNNNSDEDYNNALQELEDEHYAEEQGITSPDSNPEVETEENESHESQDDSTIPLNSPTLLLDNTTSRFSGTEWYEEIQKQKVILAGLGGIGSNAAYNLARMHLASLVMYDDDIVDTSNLSGQFYSIDDIGKFKVNAVEDALRRYTSTTNIYAIQEKFVNESEAGDIMICGFDNMAARKTFYKAWKHHVMSKETRAERAKCLFLDGRLSISVMQVFCLTGNDDYWMKKYEKEYLFSDAEADPEYNVCSLKQTTYLASMIGALMTNLFTNWVANSLKPLIPYKLPFFTEYDANYMLFREVG